MPIKKQDRELIRNYIHRVVFFRNISDEYIEKIIDDFRIIHADKNEDIIFQTDESTDLYIVLKGKVRATLLGKEGEEFIITDFKEGDFFGELSLIDGNPRSATVLAVEESVLGTLSREKFLNVIEHEPLMAVDLLKSLAMRLRQANGTIETLAFLDVRDRLVKLLLQYSETEGEKDRNGFLKIKKRTHKELASRIGASREAITKVIKVLLLNELIFEKGDHFFLSPRMIEEAEEI